MDEKTGNIVAGHGRLETLLAMKQRGESPPARIIVKDEHWLVPVIRGLSFESEKEAQAYLLADNQLTISLGFDEKLLAEILPDHQMNVTGLGFNQEELQKYIPQFRTIELEPETPIVQEQAVSRTGDLWQLDKHRILCGDSTKPDDVGKLFGNERANLMVTSPPYFNQRPEYAQWKEYDDYVRFLALAFAQASEYGASDWLVALNVGFDSSTNHDLPSSSSSYILLKNCGLKYIDTIAWVKAAAVWNVPRSQHIENGHYFPALQWEPILIFRRGSHPKFEISDRDRVREFQTNVWEFSVVIGSEQRKVGHPAMYPLELPTRLIMAYSLRGAIVHDPFLGSGTTLIAAEQLGRTCMGIEIEPRYVDVAVRRWEKATGKEARLGETGPTFKQVEAERLKQA